METLRNIILVPETMLLVYLGFSSLYFLVFAVASLFYREAPVSIGEKMYKTLVLIPSYKEDSVIVETAQSAMQQFSIRSQLDIVVIADSLLPMTIQKLRKTGVNVLPVSFTKSTKVNSIKKAFQAFKGKYDYVLVLDADNHMKEGCVDCLINKLEKGYKVVQGHRTAKNKNTNIAVLDGISEEVNNSIFRKGHRVLGLSASLIGSGFMCEYKLLRKLINSSEAVGGFDKEIELKIIEKRIRIAYAQNAIVYDEKVQQSEAFVNQRRRWLSAQFIYFRKNIYNGFVQLIKNGNVDYFDKLIQFMVPPRIISLGLTYSVSLLYLISFMLIDSIEANFIFYCWIGAAILTSLAILIAIPLNKFKIDLIKSLWTLPLGFLFTLLALLKTNGANKKFIHTPHGINKK